MDDKVNSVRLAAAEALCLTSLIDPSEPTLDEADGLVDWTDAIVVPQLYSLLQRPAVRDRQLALFMIQIIVSLGALDEHVTIGVVLPLLLNASQDAVPNVRLAVSRTLEFFLKAHMGVELCDHTELRKCLERICKDEDPDVRFHSESGLRVFTELSRQTSEETERQVTSQKTQVLDVEVGPEGP